MTIIKINWRPTARDIQKWGMIMLPATLAIGALMYWVFGHREFAVFLWSFGFLSFLTGLSGTKAAWPFYYLWMGFVFIIATVLGVAALTIAYYGVVTPIGLIAKGLGRDRLALKCPADHPSLWKPVQEAEARSSFERQF